MADFFEDLGELGGLGGLGILGGLGDLGDLGGKSNFAIKARAEAACGVSRAGAKSSLHSRVKEESVSPKLSKFSKFSKFITPPKLPTYPSLWLRLRYSRSAACK